MGAPPDDELFSALGEGRYMDAEHLARTRISIDDRDQVAWVVLGLGLRGLGRREEVLPCFECALANRDGEGWMWSNYGTVLREAGYLQESRDAYLQALEREPENPEYSVNLGYLFIELGFVAKARDFLAQALRLAPDLYGVRIHCARMYIECGEDAAAKAVLHGWPKWFGVLGGELRVELASELLRLGQQEAGESLLRSLLDDPASGAIARARLAASLERLNRVDEAESIAAELPAPGPRDDDDLRRERAALQATLKMRNGNWAEARELFLKALDQGCPRQWRISMLFQLAQVCDKQHENDACLKYLAQAHELQFEIARQLVPQLTRPDSVPLGIVDTRITQEQFRTWVELDPPTAEESPIFVVGFPRSGTTMLEQMLDAHPDMRSMDEQPFVQRMIERMQAAGLRYPQDLGSVDARLCEDMRRTYNECVANVVQLKPGQRLVDKNPLTMLRLPLLRRVFPNARIIFVQRHPCDVLLSCYMQHFNAPAFTVLCSTLERLARGYAKAMDFWMDQVQILQPCIYVWRYEAAIEDFENEVQLLAGHLDLKDSQPLHDFSAHARAKGYIGTPSYAQVTNPLYKNSRGRWRRYRDFFEPVLPILEPLMQRWNYDA